MSRHAVETRPTGEEPGSGLLQSLGAALEAIRQRAYDLFRSRGGQGHADLDDWLRAERELFEVPPCELTDVGDAFQMMVAAPGFASNQLEVAVDGGSVTVLGQAEKRHEKSSAHHIYSEFERKDLFRRFHLPERIEADRVTANLTDDGYLRVTMPKAAHAISAGKERQAAA